MSAESEKRGMATLLFEVWENCEGDGIETEMSPVSRRNDDLRKKITPKAILRHAFRATSDFEASQFYYDWMGFGTWRPEPDWPERRFADEEAREQELYLLVRNQLSR
jgi:hypothetical protein